MRTAFGLVLVVLVKKAGPQPITKADIEAKLRQVQRQVGGLQRAGSGRGGRAAAAGAAALVAAAYLLGRRRGRSSRAMVEVRRV